MLLLRLEGILDFFEDSLDVFIMQNVLTLLYLAGQRLVPSIGLARLRLG